MAIINNLPRTINKEQINSILYGIGVDTFNRFQTFLSMADSLKGENYWYALNCSYLSSDNLYQFRHLVRQAFLSNEPGREFLMDEQEREYLKSLPDQITIYRGMTIKEYDSNNFGISWTLKKEIAEFFTTYIRNIDTGHLKKVVCELVINKNEVIAYFNERQEFEIIFIKS